MNVANEGVKDAAAQVILAALKTAEQTGEWIKVQVPDVLQQLIRYNIVSDIALIAMFLAPLVLLCALCFAYRKLIRKTAEDIEALLALSFCGAVVTIPFLIGVAVNAFDLLKITIAPKVWLLEYARGLLH